MELDMQWTPIPHTAGYGAPEWWEWARWVAVDANGHVYVYRYEPRLSLLKGNPQWTNDSTMRGSCFRMIGQVVMRADDTLLPWKELRFRVAEDE